MSATSNRLAKLHRAVAQIRDYEDHKADWTGFEQNHFDAAIEALGKLINHEKQRISA